MSEVMNKIMGRAQEAGVPNFRHTIAPCCYHCVYLVWRKGTWKCIEYEFDVADSAGVLTEFVCDSFVLDHSD